jgi:hypothetical protein
MGVGCRDADVRIEAAAGSRDEIHGHGGRIAGIGGAQRRDSSSTAPASAGLNGYWTVRKNTYAGAEVRPDPARSSPLRAVPNARRSASAAHGRRAPTATTPRA